ncbi:MAG: type I restriction enzyme HsdR N-terminal domain-containing protein [Bacteroidales bacterium]|nr:type I restriction enzyme HsdR N-terminal domain-containing protein [Bacteroidales bacterium]
MSNPFIRLAFPEYKFRLKKTNERVFIFDDIRKKWIVCTPEEWVRQNLIMFLIKDLKFPINYIAVEKGLKIAGREFRFDALVYDRGFKPLVVVECKAPEIGLDQSVFDQVLHYNYEINAPFFLITNGFGFIMGKTSAEKGVTFLEKPPMFDELVLM